MFRASVSLPPPHSQGRTSLLKGPPALGGIRIYKLDISDLILGDIPDWKASALDKSPRFCDDYGDESQWFLGYLIVVEPHLADLEVHLASGPRISCFCRFAYFFQNSFPALWVPSKLLLSLSRPRSMARSFVSFL